MAVSRLCSQCGSALPDPTFPPCPTCGREAELPKPTPDQAAQLRSVYELVGRNVSAALAPTVKLLWIVALSLLLNLLLAVTLLVVLFR